MSKPLLSLCGLPKQAVRDGYVGAEARLLLPFYSYGYWFASGQQYTFPSGEATQQLGLTENGVRQADTYTKAAGICLRPD